MSSTVNAPRDLAHPRSVRLLGSYRPGEGTCSREVAALAAPDGSVLVVDRLTETLGDARLVARLTSDEPRENARIVAEMYLSDQTRGRCRRLTPEDWTAGSLSARASSPQRTATSQASLLGDAAHIYRIRIVNEGPSFSELRWTRQSSSSAGSPCELLTLRDVIADLEDYEPASAMTAAALETIGEDDPVSTSRLQGELERIRCSPIVLNRRLREAVQRNASEGGLSLSEIALRCGRSKRDRRGTLSGETSWLARRIGAMPEGGEAEPTRWVHSDTLALIAREGLGLSPNEVEL